MIGAGVWSISFSYWNLTLVKDKKYSNGKIKERILKLIKYETKY
jgi:hypothetical protein